MTLSALDLRENLVTFLRRDLIGPAHGENEIIEDPPKIRYTAGVLFPQDSLRNESAATAGIEEDIDTPIPGTPDVIVAEDGDEGFTLKHKSEPVDSENDDLITLANSYRPSAVGLTFMVTATRLVVRARAALYESAQSQVAEQQRPHTVWTRRPLSIEPFIVDLATQSTDAPVADGLNLRIHARRRRQGRYLVTVSLYNTTREYERTAKTFFQTGFSVECEGGVDGFVEYRSREDDVPGDDEAVTLAMLYRNRRVFAVGHGCAGDWTATTSDRTMSVSTQDLPAVAVPPIIPLADNRPYLDMSFLGGKCENPRRDIPTALSALCDEYEAWIRSRAHDAKQLSAQFRRTAEQSLEFCHLTAQRMRAGVRLVAEDDSVLQAFMLLNRAMLMQQVHSRLRRRLSDPWKELPTLDGYASNWDSRVGFWRAFQLAFILVTLPGMTSETSTVTLPGGDRVSERDLVDLIWFPTGGGKTEAYLGLTAFVIFMARFRDPGDVGCKVLMRYTLRLLTSQQFQRAASLICACERIRRTDPQRFGNTPISIGLWVGQSLTPNDERDALQKLSRYNRMLWIG